MLGLSTLVFVYNMVASWRGGPRAPANPWRALTLEWQVSSPPPIFNFDHVPTVVGGPYEYGVPDAVHGIFKPAEEARPKQPAGATVAPRVGARGSSQCRPCSSSRTRRSPASALLDRIRERARRGRALLRRRAADAAAPRQRHLRRGRARLRAGPRRPGAGVHARPRRRSGDGEVGDGDPFNAAMDAMRAQPIDEIIVSTLPGDVLGLAAARPDRAPRGGDRRCRSSTSSSTSRPRACRST